MARSRNLYGIGSSAYDVEAARRGQLGRDQAFNAGSYNPIGISVGVPGTPTYRERILGPLPPGRGAPPAGPVNMGPESGGGMIRYLPPEMKPGGGDSFKADLGVPDRPFGISVGVPGTPTYRERILGPLPPSSGRVGSASMPTYQMGGMVGPGGMPIRPDMGAMTPYSTTSLDLPPALASLLAPTVTPAMGPGGIGTYAMDNRAAMMGSAAMPAYQMGGMVGPGGMPMRPDMGMGSAMGGMPGLAPAGAMQQTLSPGQIPGEVQRFVQQNPDQMNQIRMQIEQLVQSGQVTAQELNMMVQMAQAAASNPALYKQLRMIAIQRGLAGPDELSEEFDAGLVFVLLLMGAAMSGGMGGGQMSQMPQMMPSMKKGGMLPNRNGDNSEAVVAQLHEGEYVIPAHVVRAKGTEFFDKLLETHKKSDD